MRQLMILVFAIFLAFTITGCGRQFTATDIKVSAIETRGSLSDLYPDAGLLYDFFTEYNAWTPTEEKMAMGYYSDMIRAIEKLERKIIAGQTDYHRLLYFTEDITDAWEGLRPMLDATVNAMLPTENDTIKYAVGLYRRVKADVDSIISRNNVNLAKARDDLDDATYAAIKEDTVDMVKTLVPFFQKGAAFLL